MRLKVDINDNDEHIIPPPIDNIHDPADEQQTQDEDGIPFLFVVVVSASFALFLLLVIVVFVVNCKCRRNKNHKKEHNNSSRYSNINRGPKTPPGTLTLWVKDLDEEDLEEDEYKEKLEHLHHHPPIRNQDFASLERTRSLKVTSPSSRARRNRGNIFGSAPDMRDMPRGERLIRKALLVTENETIPLDDDTGVGQSRDNGLRHHDVDSGRGDSDNEITSRDISLEKSHTLPYHHHSSSFKKSSLLLREPPLPPPSSFKDYQNQLGKHCTEQCLLLGHSDTCWMPEVAGSDCEIRLDSHLSPTVVYFPADHNSNSSSGASCSSSTSSSSSHETSESSKNKNLESIPESQIWSSPDGSSIESSDHNLTNSDYLQSLLNPTSSDRRTMFPRKSVNFRPPRTSTSNDSVNTNTTGYISEEAV